MSANGQWLLLVGRLTDLAGDELNAFLDKLGGTADGREAYRQFQSKATDKVIAACLERARDHIAAKAAGA